MDGEQKICKAHALVLLLSAQGHINPMLQFSKRLAFKGVKVTLAITRFMSKSMYIDPNTNFNLETISDGFDEGGYAQAKSPENYFSTSKIVGSQTLVDLINKLSNSGSPVTAIIYDGLLNWALDVAKQFGIIGAVFFTQSCAVSTVYYHVYKGFVRLPLESNTVISLPGMPFHLQVSEVPSLVRDFREYLAIYDLLVNQFVNIDEADWVIHNTFQNMEEKEANWLAEKWKVITIGPTLPSMYLDKRIEGDKNYGINLFKPNSSECMKWLQDKPAASVLYVSFGSLIQLGEEQMEEIAWALKETNFYFLWVVRESEQSKLPNGFFIEETCEEGLVVSWCPQLEVLENEAIGCFITHCGCGSMLEALSLGVPMVAVPQFSDQPTNAKYVEDVWKVGIRALPDEKGIVRRRVLEECIREVMEGDKGKEIKENAIKWKNLSKEAISEGGTSDRNINEFVAKLISS